MTERITAQMQSSNVLANLNNDLSALDTTQEQISTGLSINQPSDNPDGTALALQLSGQIAAMNSYTANVNDGTAWSSTASAALQSIQQMVQTARTLVVEGGNGALNQTNLTSIGDEISQIVSDIKQTANTQYNGMYIFSGTATGTAPYLTAAGQDTFQGNAAAIIRSIGPGTSLQVNANLNSVLGGGQAAADGGLLDTLETAAQDLTTGNTANLGTDLTALDANMTTLDGVQADVGATQDRLEMASTRITALQTADQTQLGNTEDVDMAQASINLSTEQAAYSAALQSGAQIIQTSLLSFLSTPHDHDRELAVRDGRDRA